MIKSSSSENGTGIGTAGKIIIVSVLIKRYYSRSTN
jgi:hypothetical protein